MGAAASGERPVMDIRAPRCEWPMRDSHDLCGTGLQVLRWLVCIDSSGGLPRGAAPPCRCAERGVIMENTGETWRAVEVAGAPTASKEHMSAAGDRMTLESTSSAPDVAASDHDAAPTALDYVIDQEQHLVTIIGDCADMDAWQRLLSRVLHDPRHEAGFLFLRDLRHAAPPADAEQVNRVIEAIRGFWPYLQPCRGAVVTAEHPATVVAAADTLANTHGLPVRLFDSYDAALSWLQSEEQVVGPVSGAALNERGPRQ